MRREKMVRAVCLQRTSERRELNREQMGRQAVGSGARQPTEDCLLDDYVPDDFSAPSRFHLFPATLPLPEDCCPKDEALLVVSREMKNTTHRQQQQLIEEGEERTYTQFTHK